MTYCCGVLVKEGVAIVADTRTNAGVDNISTFRKLSAWENPGEKVWALASAGNLGVSQAVRAMLEDGFDDPIAGENATLAEARTMLHAAEIVGRAVLRARDIYEEPLKKDGVPFDVSFLLAGQVKGRRLRLFRIYAAGNFIECTPDTPYMQIGEHKYGKPIFDRAVSFDTPVLDALKIGLLSMDSTMRSNLAVGAPLDLIVIRRDACRIDLRKRIDATDPYFADLRERWSRALRAAHAAIPAPPYSGVEPE
jgi:putative proteasome-type protease